MSQRRKRLPVLSYLITDGHDQTFPLDIKNALGARSNELPKYEENVVPSSLICT